MTNTINRTYHEKYTTYWGDGSGRDGHIVFANGGLHEMRDYRGPEPKPGFNGQKGRPSKTYAAPKKDATAFDYVPDGTGRDSYIIFNYGLKANYRSSFREFERGLRTEEGTPAMDAKMARKNDPFNVDISSYRNWYHPQVQLKQNRDYNEQRSSVERLSKSPPHKSSRSKLTLDQAAENLGSSITKPRGSHSVQQNELRLPESKPGMLADNFFKQRASLKPCAEIIHTNTTPIKLQRKNFEINHTRGGYTTQKAGKLQSRKLSMQSTLQPNTMKASDLDGFLTSHNVTYDTRANRQHNEIQVALSKKLQQQPRAARAHTSLQFSQPIVSIAARGLTTAEPAGRTGVRIKKVGNLASMDGGYHGARMRMLNNTMLADRIAPRHLFTQQASKPEAGTDRQANNELELDQLQQQNVTLRERISQQKDTYRDLDLKKMETEITKGTAVTNYDTSCNGNGTPFKNRRSTQLQSDEYGSVEGSPLKVDGRSTLIMKQILNDRRGSVGTRGPTGVNPRSQSVQRNGQMAAMAKTAPQGGFYKQPTSAVPQTAIARSPRATH